MSDARHITQILDGLPSIASRVGPSAYLQGIRLLEAAGFLSASELALALHCSETHAEACLAAYYRARPEAWAAELRRRRSMDEF